MGCEGCDVNTNDSAHQSLIADVVRPAGKVVVFGIPKRHDKVYTVLVDNAKPDTLIPVIRHKIMPDGIVCTDSLSSYGKPDVSSFIHHRINHFKKFADRQNHINGIENFWNQAKRVYANTTESIANPSRCS